nr:unnamed protein product [Haemonchus contortus]
MEKCASLKSKLGEAANEKSEQNPKELEKEIKELKRLVEIKTREVNRLGDSEEKLRELENMVEQLTKENTRLEQICDEADESESKLKQRIAELEKQVSTRKVPDEKSRPEIPPPRLLDALGHKFVNLKLRD